MLVPFLELLFILLNRKIIIVAQLLSAYEFFLWVYSGDQNTGLVRIWYGGKFLVAKWYGL